MRSDDSSNSEIENSVENQYHDKPLNLTDCIISEQANGKNDFEADFVQDTSTALEGDLGREKSEDKWEENGFSSSDKPLSNISKVDHQIGVEERVAGHYRIARLCSLFGEKV